MIWIFYVGLSLMFSGFVLLYGLLAHQAVEPLEHVSKAAAVLLVWPIMALLYIGEQVLSLFDKEAQTDD